MVKSRFSAALYVVLISLTALLFCSLYLISDANPAYKKKIPLPIDGLILLLLWVFLFYAFIRKIRITRINAGHIDIKGLLKNWHIDTIDIKSIDLLPAHDSTDIEIILKDDKKVIISGSDYQNIHKIKQSVKDRFNEKILPFGTVKPTKSRPIISNAGFEKFAGNPHSSLNGLAFYAFSGLALYYIASILRHGPAWALFLITIPCLFLYWAGSQLHFFLLSDKKLIVKNHFFFWVNTIYDVDDIIQVEFKLGTKASSSSLKITGSDFRSRVYSAGSLREKTWKDLKKMLNKLDLNFLGYSFVD